MSDAHTTESASAEQGATQPPRQRRRSRGRRWLVASFAVLVLGMMAVLAPQIWGWRLWEHMQHDDRSFQAATATVEDRLAALESVAATQQQMQAEMNALRQGFLRDRLLLQVDHIEEQMDAGWQIWLVTGQRKTLVTALENGQRWLAGVAMPEAQALHLALTKDLADLRGRQMVDLQEAMQQVDGLIASVDSLALLQDRRLPPPDNAVDRAKARDADQAAASGALSAERLMAETRRVVGDVMASIWQSIRQMVRVQRLDRAEPALLAPEQKVFLQQGLRLLLLDARHALIQRNTALYQQSLAQARAWIAKYGDPSNAQVSADLALLQQLSGLNLDPASVNLDATRQALALLRSALLGVDAPGDHTATPDLAAPPAEAAKGSAT